MINRLNFKQIFFSLLILSVCFLFIYHFYLKELLLNYFRRSPDYLDKNYYSGIFNNLEYSISFSLIILFFVGFYSDKILLRIKGLSLNKLFFYLISFQCLIQILNIFLIDTIQHSDASFYLIYGKKLAETGNYLSPQGYPTAFWPIGVPAMIAFFVKLGLEPAISFQILNIILSALTLLVLYKIFSRLLSKEQLKYFLIIYVLYPNNLFSTQSVLTEIPFIFLVCLSLLLFIKAEEINYKVLMLIIGVIIGIATLIRANSILFVLIFAILILKYFNKEKIKSLCLLLVGFVIVITPWTVRNYTHFKSLVLSSTNLGYIFLMGNHKNSLGNVNFDFTYDFNNKNEADESTEAIKKAILDLKSEPFEALIRIPKKIFWSYWRGDHAVTWALKETKSDTNDKVKSFVFYLCNFYFYTVLVLSIIGFYNYWNRKDYRLEVSFMILFYLLNLLLIIIFVGNERYIYPVFVVHLFFMIKYSLKLVDND